jgi:hypothetical protein
VAYPNGAGAIIALWAACEIQPIGSAETPSVGELIDKAQECKSANTHAYQATLGDWFAGNVVEQRQAYSWLMNAPFKTFFRFWAGQFSADEARTTASR